MDDDDNEHIVFTTHETGSSKITFDPSEEGINFNEPNVSISDKYDEHLIFYNWLADSATTSAMLAIFLYHILGTAHKPGICIAETAHHPNFSHMLLGSLGGIYITYINGGRIGCF